MNGTAPATTPPAAPARRQVRGENRWPATVAVLAASGLQMTLPPWLAFGPQWLLPALEIGLLGALVASSPGRLERRSAALRAGGLALAGLLSLTNATFAILLVDDLARGAPAGEVWALLRDFAAIGDWHPALPPAEIEDGPADRVGCVRVYPLAGGHRETLVALDDQQRRIAFIFADHAAGLPVRSYTSTITARPVTLTDGTYVEWSSRFDCDEADEDKAIAAIRDGVLVPGLRALEQRFGRASSAP